MPSSLAPSSFPATQQDPPARAQLLEDATASLQLLMSGATNPEGRPASVRDFDLNKEPYDPLPDEPPEASTILLSPDSSHVQANVDVEMETMGTTVTVYPSKITPLVDSYRSLGEKSADETLEAASGKKRRGSGTNRASAYINSETADEIAMASSLKEGEVRCPAAADQGATVLQEELPRMGVAMSQSGAPWQPGYAVSLKHVISRRILKKLQARSESKTADADASTWATGGRKETGPSSSEPLVGAKQRKAGTRPMRFLPDKAGPAPVHERLEPPCIVINIVVGSEQRRQ